MANQQESASTIRMFLEQFESHADKYLNALANDSIDMNRASAALMYSTSSDIAKNLEISGKESEAVALRALAERFSPKSFEATPDESKGNFSQFVHGMGKIAGGAVVNTNATDTQLMTQLYANLAVNNLRSENRRNDAELIDSAFLGRNSEAVANKISFGGLAFDNMNMQPAENPVYKKEVADKAEELSKAAKNEKMAALDKDFEKLRTLTNAIHTPELKSGLDALRTTAKAANHGINNAEDMVDVAEIMGGEKTTPAQLATSNSSSNYNFKKPSFSADNPDVVKAFQVMAEVNGHDLSWTNRRGEKVDGVDGQIGKKTIAAAGEFYDGKNFDLGGYYSTLEAGQKQQVLDELVSRGGNLENVKTQLLATQVENAAAPKDQQYSQTNLPPAPAVTAGIDSADKGASPVV